MLILPENLISMASFIGIDPAHQTRSSGRACSIDRRQPTTSEANSSQGARIGAAPSAGGEDRLRSAENREY